MEYLSWLLEKLYASIGEFYDWWVVKIKKCCIKLDKESGSEKERIQLIIVVLMCHCSHK